MSDTQERLALELMPQILRALECADDASRGWRRDETRPHGQRTIPVSPEQGLAALRKLELGALLDRLGDWCWCPETPDGDAHDGSCTDLTSGLIAVDQEAEIAVAIAADEAEQERAQRAKDLDEQHRIDEHLDRVRGIDQ